MDDRFRGKEAWIVVGVLGIVFVCLMLCMLGAGAMLLTRSEATYIQPPQGLEEVVPPQLFRGPFGVGTHPGFGLLQVLGCGFGLFLFGLILLLFFGFFKRCYWGPRHYHRWPKGPGPWGKGEGKEWQVKPHPPWGPWAWHYPAEPGEAEGEAASQEEEPDLAQGGDE